MHSAIDKAVKYNVYKKFGIKKSFNIYKGLKIYTHGFLCYLFIP